MSCDHFSVGWARLADERGVASYAVWWGLTLAAPNAASPHSMWKPTLTTEKTRLSVTDLHAGEEYMVRVAAVYEGEPSGIGAWSQPLRITTVAYGGQECVSPDESSCTRCRVAVACYTGPGCESSPPPLPPPPPRPPPPSPPKGPIGEELSAESFFSLQGLYGRSSDYLKATSFGSSKNGGGDGGGNSVVAAAKGAAAADIRPRRWRWRHEARWLERSFARVGDDHHGRVAARCVHCARVVPVGSLFGTGRAVAAVASGSELQSMRATTTTRLTMPASCRPPTTDAADPRVEANEIFLTALQDAASEPPAPSSHRPRRRLPPGARRAGAAGAAPVGRSPR